MKGACAVGLLYPKEAPKLAVIELLRLAVKKSYGVALRLTNQSADIRIN